jgi:hypothetical protein
MTKNAYDYSNWYGSGLLEEVEGSRNYRRYQLRPYARALIIQAIEFQPWPKKDQSRAESLLQMAKEDRETYDLLDRDLEKLLDCLLDYCVHLKRVEIHGKTSSEYVRVKNKTHEIIDLIDYLRSTYNYVKY